MIDDVKPASGSAKRTSENQEIKTVAPETPAQSTAETTFQTPDQIASADDLGAPPADVSAQPRSQPQAEPAAATPTGNTWKSRLALQWPPRKKEYAAAGLFIVVLLAGTLSWLALSSHPKATAVIVPKAIVKKPQVIAKVTTAPSTLTGLAVDPSVNQRPTTAVMIENSIEARPQSGLSQAGVVFEAIAEGGITRFMAVYQDTAPDNVGPIRSARPYYVAWSQGFDAGYAHVGGSPDGLAAIKAWSVRDLDQFANGGSYHRVSTRQAPHNVYTGIATLNQLETAKGYGSSSYTGFIRKVAAPSAAPTAKAIDFSLSGYYYNPHFDYNPATNSYNRSEAGAPQTDQNSGQQLSPNVVIALVTPLGQGVLDASGAYYSNYSVIGSGAAYVFQDGTVTPCQWNKASNASQITFTDAAGKPIGLNPGQTWLTALSSANGVKYTP
jgi:hypothetical protein